MWEYKVMCLRKMKLMNMRDQMIALDEAGREEWELVGVVDTEQGTYAYLKRPGKAAKALSKG